MLTVKTHISRSKIHRFGCFASAPIKKDDVVWTYDVQETYDKVIPYLEKFGWYDEMIEMRVYPMDNARYINHTENSNTYVDEGQMKAKCDIPAGTEITENYKDYMNEEDIKKHLG